MKNHLKTIISIFILTIIILYSLSVFVSRKTIDSKIIIPFGITYDYEEYPIIRNNIKLHLDKVQLKGKHPKKNILLIHGLTYSSHEFDINYKDYSLVRTLARAGYSVWRLDIAGYGRSESVKNGFLPNSDYAAEDINAATEKIKQITGVSKIDLMGWSWGTVTSSKFASKHPEHLNKLILFAPIISGIGKCPVTNPFHHNTWEHSIDDFQKNSVGNFDYSITDPIIVELWASSCWHYDGEKSPNGGRRDICVDNSKILIDLTQIKTPTLILYGDNDPYLNYKLLESVQTLLPEKSTVKILKGASHVAFMEKPFYKIFQKTVINFLKK